MKRTRIAPRSAARQGDGYSDFVRELLAADPRCHVGPLIRLEDPKWDGCLVEAQGLHHLRKQGAAGARVSEANTLRCCNPCNGYIEDHPDEAKAAGLVMREAHPEFVGLGRRAAREAV